MAPNKSEKRILREFGLTVGIAFGVLAALLFWRERSHYVYFAWLAGAFILLGLVVPGILKPVRKGWMTAAAAMGWVMTRVILTVLYFGVFTPIAFIAKLAGKRFLHLAIDPSAESYWVRRDASASEPETLRKQF
jgi:hypothetical protein